MNTSTAASLLAGLVLTVAAVPLQAQRVEARVVVHDGYSTYRRPVTRRVIVVERPRVIVVERVHRHHHRRHWSRRGYRPMTLYYWDGRYYDRHIGHRHGVREVVVWERDGRYYHDDCGADRHWDH